MLFRVPGRGEKFPGSSWNYAARVCIVIGLPFAVLALAIPWYGLVQNLLRVGCLAVALLACLGARYCVGRENDFISVPLSEDYQAS